MSEVLIFAAQALIIFLVIAGLIVLLAMMIARGSASSDLEVTALDEKWKDLKFFMNSFVLDKDELKAEKKRLKKEKKAESKLPEPEPQGRVFVFRFDGDVKANQVDSLREEINAVIQVAGPQDEAVIVLESPGGMVSGYGLAAAQLLRLRDRGVKVTSCVDQVAASGGYLMAVTSHQILAAPFAILGSIGVVAQVPNFNRLLKRHDIEYKEYTAGEFKRTVSIFGEITPAGEAKFKEQLEETHVQFKDFVHRYRPNLRLEEVATGEYWYGERALQLGLIDAIKTSDDYLFEKLAEKKQILEVKHKQKLPLSEKLAEMVSASVAASIAASSKALTRTLSKEATKPLT
ncbi:MAG: protease SohB [Bdellovibrionaceae bacterium]|nr:protease SohB [Pseudobdellovibrionaceae bacterium]